MESSINSPVPKEQIPLHEFNELSASMFFSWPQKGRIVFFRNSFFSWLLTYPIFLIICSGSYLINDDIAKLLIISFISSIIIPSAIFIRQYLGWNYIFKRLLSHKIIYEVSDWHDGQTWEKPMLWKIRDNLIANQDVLPILLLIRKFTVYLILLLLLSIGTFYLISYI